MYFITCFEKLPTRDDSFDIGCSRCFGYKKTFEEAKEALHNNTCNMHEYLYKFAVIEKLGPYIHPEVEQHQFFKYDANKKGFFEIDDPKELNHLTNFSLG